MRQGKHEDDVADHDDLSEAEIEQLWLEESLRRHQEVASGAVETVSVEEALAKARAARR